MCWTVWCWRSMTNGSNILMKKETIPCQHDMNMKWGSGGWSRGVMASSVYSLLSYQPFEENHQAISSNVFNFTTRWHSCAPKCCKSQAFFFFDALQQWILSFLCSLLFDCDIWAINSICWGESEVVLKRHFSAILQSCKVLNQKYFALEVACVWKDQHPQPCAMCTIRYAFKFRWVNWRVLSSDSLMTPLCHIKCNANTVYRRGKKLNNLPLIIPFRMCVITHMEWWIRKEKTRRETNCLAFKHMKFSSCIQAHTKPAAARKSKSKE